MVRRITFTIKDDGKIEVDANGFKGKTCIKDTDKALLGLGPTLQNRTLKAEYQQTEVATTQQERCGQ